LTESPVKKKASPKKKPPPYCMAISNAQGEERTRMEKTIRRLGGTIEGQFTTQTTHLITPEPSMTAKCLAACITGCWMLKPSFVEESAKQGTFLQEHPFQWKPQDCKKDAAKIVQVGQLNT